MLGVDVSKYQGDINWMKVSNAFVNGEQIRFAIVRSTIGILKKDEYFDRNFDGARAVGLAVSWYHVVRNDATADDQLAYMLEAVGNRVPDLPITLDVELPRDGSIHARLITCETALTMATLLRRSGYGVSVYTARWWMQPVIDQYPQSSILRDLARFDLHVAHYAQVTSPIIPSMWRQATIWQFTDKGKIDGVNANVDLNRFLPPP